MKLYFILFSIGILIAGYFIATGYHTASFKLTRNMAAWKYHARAEKAGVDQVVYAQPSSREQAIPVIVYHGLLEEEDSDRPNFTTEKFEDHIFSLKKAGYNSITVDDLYKFLKNEATLPPNPILITFDDGRTDSLKFADPILRAVHYNAVMFAIGTHSIGNERRGKYYLTPFELKSMANTDVWDVEAHSFDGHGNYPLSGDENDTGHFFGSAFWLQNENRSETPEESAERISNDMQKIKSNLEESLEKPVISFAYPFGDYGQNNFRQPHMRDITLAATKQFYKLAFYQNAPGYRYTLAYRDPDKVNEDFFLIRRINIDASMSGEDLVKAIERGQLKDLPFEDDFSMARGWISQWGESTIAPNKLSLRPEPGGTGGDVVLDGSQLWRNYEVTAEVESTNRTGVYIIVRFADDKNYAGCNFSNGFIHVQDIVDGKTRVAKGVRSSNISIPSGNFTIKASVKDRTLQCTMGGTTVSTEFLDESLNKGGVGFKAWDETPGLSDVHIRNVSVTPLE